MGVAIKRSPCASCPYRKDVPSGIWHEDEYAKITPYDLDTASQPLSLFLCHQNDGCLCRGWLDCHGAELLALRMAAIKGDPSQEEIAKALDEGSAVPVFTTAAAAAKHGRKSIKRPGPKAKTLINKIEKRRGFD